MSQDLVIGGIDNYDWSKVKNWILSLNQCGFNGRKILIGYRVEDELSKKILDHGIELYKIDKDYFNRPIEHNFKGRDTQAHQMRFYHIWQMITELGIDNFKNVISTDVRDVIFQRNPSEWLDKNLKEGQIIAPSECAIYKTETWNADNMVNGFGPYVWEYLTKEFVICNVGTIAGSVKLFSDVCLLIYLISVGHYIPSDQSAFNLITNTILKDKTRFTKMQESWCVSCALCLEPKYAAFKPHLLENLPVIKDGEFYTETGEKFYLVHQYDRLPGINEIIENRYK